MKILLKELKKNNMYLDFSTDEGFNWEIISLCNDKFFEYYQKGVYFMPDFTEWFCAGQEWVYLINLDDNVFEIYKGKYTHTYVADSILEEINRYKEKYELLAQFDLSNVPKDWYLAPLG